MNLDTAIPVIKTGIVSREEKKGVLLYNAFTKRKYLANNLARIILKECNGKNTLSEIYSKITPGNSIDRVVFCDFLENLYRTGIVDFKGLGLVDKRKLKERLDETYPYSNPNISLILRAPSHVYWELTYKCNLDCKHCYVKDKGLNEQKELTTSECLKVIDDLACLEVFEITFSGGEPLLRKDLLILIEHASKRGIAPSITSNGTLINDALAMKLKLTGLTAAQISLDGSNSKTHDSFRRIPGSFNNAIKGIQSLVKAKIPVIIATVPTKSNLPEIKKIINLAKKLKVQGYRILECKPFGRGKNVSDEIISFAEYKNLLDLIVNERSKSKDFFILLSESFAFLTNNHFSRKSNDQLIDCPAGRSMCSINPEGFVAPCSYFEFAGLNIGNVLHNDIGKIWKTSSLLKEIRKIDFSKREYINSYCSKCKYHSVCGRGCRALAYVATKDLTGIDPRCIVLQGKGGE